MDRQESASLKTELRRTFPKYGFSVRSGRGTAYAWVYVRTDAPMVHWAVIGKIAARYAGSYMPDCAPGLDEWTPCVRVEALRRSG